MARCKSSERNIRTLTKFANGRSYVLTLPIGILRAWDWREHKKLILVIDDAKRRITITPAKD